MTNKKNKKNKKNKNIIPNLFWSIKVLWKFKITYMVFLVVESIMKGLAPIIVLLLTQQLINKIQLREGVFENILVLLVSLVMFELLGELCLNTIQTKISNNEEEFSTYIQVSILNKVSELDSKDFENSSTYDLVSRTQYDADMGILGNIKALFSMFSLVIATLSYMVIMIKYNPIILIIIIIIPIIRYYFEKKYNLMEYDVINKNTEKERKSSYITYRSLRLQSNLKKKKEPSYL